MTERDLDRWDALLDREAMGEALPPQDAQFLQDFASAHPEYAREHALLEELSQLDATPDADSGALVDAVMARLQDGDAEVHPATESESPRALGHLATRRIAVWLGAAALVGVGLWTSLMPPQPAPLAEHDSPAAPPPASRFELVYASGDARLDGTETAAGGALLRVGQVVSTAEGNACFVLDPGIDVCLDAHSKLRVGALEGPERKLALQAGRVSLRLDKQPAGSSITIEAGGVASTAIGTAYSVRLAEEGVATSVMEGRVRVVSGGRVSEVAAHQRITVDDGDRAMRSGMSRAQESAEWGALSTRALWQGEVSGELHVSGEPKGAEVWLDGRTIGALPLSSLVPVGSHVLVVRQGEQVLHELQFEARAGHRETVQVLPLPTPTTDAAEEAAAVRPGRRTAGPSPTELLSGARHMMVDGRWEDAAAIYRALRRQHPDSPEAHTVLVSLAQLELDRLGQPGKALSLLDRYLAGGGELKQEARYTRIRALRRLDLPEAEQDAIELFLSAHPRSFHARRLQRRLQELQAGTP